MDWVLMPLRRYAEFSGRSRRTEYWAWVLMQIVVGIAFWTLLLVVANVTIFTLGDSIDPAALGAGVLILFGLFFLLWLFLLIPSLAVTVRRLHDSNRSGWWILGPMVPYALGWFALAAAVGDGKPALNPAAGPLVLIGVLAFLVSVIFGLVMLIFMLLEGTPGPNRYGPDPKGRTEASVFS